MKLVSLFISLFFLNNIYSQNNSNNNTCNEFSLSLNVRNIQTDTMRLFYFDCENVNYNERYLVISNGKTKIKGKINKVAEGILFINPKDRFMDGPNVIKFIIEPKEMSLSFNLKGSSVENITITESKTQLEKEEWERNNSILFKNKDSLDSKLQLSFKADSVKINNLQSYRSDLRDQSKKVYQKIIHNSILYIKANPNSYLSGYLLQRYLRKIPLDSAKNYYKSLASNVKYSTFGRQSLQYIFNQTDDANFRKDNSDSAFFNRLSKIKRLHDISLPDESGKIVALSKFKGRYVLLDFWGSWCGPCIKNVPYLAKLKDEMKNEPIAFVSISLDRDANVWKKAIKQHDYPGLNLIDSTQFVATFYKIPWVPVYVIINPDGSIANADAPQPISGELKPLLYSIIHNRKNFK